MIYNNNKTMQVEKNYFFSLKIAKIGNIQEKSLENIRNVIYDV